MNQQLRILFIYVLFVILNFNCKKKKSFHIATWLSNQLENQGKITAACLEMEIKDKIAE